MAAPTCEANGVKHFMFRISTLAGSGEQVFTRHLPSLRETLYGVQLCGTQPNITETNPNHTKARHHAGRAQTHSKFLRLHTAEAQESNIPEIESDNIKRAAFFYK